MYRKAKYDNTGYKASTTLPKDFYKLTFDNVDEDFINIVQAKTTHEPDSLANIE